MKGGIDRQRDVPIDLPAFDLRQNRRNLEEHASPAELAVFLTITSRVYDHLEFRMTARHGVSGKSRRFLYGCDSSN